MKLRTRYQRNGCKTKLPQIYIWITNSDRDTMGHFTLSVDRFKGNTYFYRSMIVSHEHDQGMPKLLIKTAQDALEDIAKKFHANLVHEVTLREETVRDKLEKYFITHKYQPTKRSNFIYTSSLTELTKHFAPNTISTSHQ